MIIDKQLQFADGTWAPTATGDNVSPNVYDTAPLGGVPTVNGGMNLGEGEELYLVITVKTTVTSGGAATVDFRLRTDSAASLVSAPVDLVSSGAIAKASLVAGYQVKLKLPNATYKRYIGVNANIGTAVLTAGAFEAEIVKNLSSNTKYAGSFGLDS
jgi:hypothetical protein